MIRPWRVGVLVDTTSPAEVRDAIANLSSVWGGRSMPIFDKDTPTAELEKLGEMFGVDSLYADVAEGPLAEFLRKPGWVWQGRAQWGPFGREEDVAFRKGLLPIKELLDESNVLILPSWSLCDSADLAFAAMWGLPDKSDAAHDTLPYLDLLADQTLRSAELGLIAATARHIDPESGRGHGSQDGVYVLRSDHPEDIVSFWNMRALGGTVLGVPEDASPELLKVVLCQPLPSYEVTSSSGIKRHALDVYGGDNASPQVIKAIESAARATETVLNFSRPEFSSPYAFGGLKTHFKRNVRIDFRPAGHGIDVGLPRLPLAPKPSSTIRRGLVAAEVDLREVRGQDPRFTGHIPPYRQHAALLGYRQVHQTVDHARSGYDGLVFGVDVDGDELHVPFAYSQEVLRLLFDDESVEVSQSNVGKFQTRAAENFGGPYSGTFNQPGVRAAVTMASVRPAGVTLLQLRGAVEKARGSWPHSLMDHNSSPRDYSIRAVNHLFHSGLFVPTSKVHCSHCRVENHVSVESLAPTMTCEFCGQAFNLSLSHSLAQPEWRYRLAAHLRPDQIEALLPALATTTLLQQLRHTEELPPLVLGLEVTLEGKKVEADIASYLGDRDLVTVLGEVKTANRIDSKDVANLEFLRAKLHAKGIRCLLLFATLKNDLSPEERRDLRGLVERSSRIRTSSGTSSPNFPMVLTGPDLSRHYWDEEHPWRWEKKGQNGIFDTALVSCERNLGLVGYDGNPNSESDGADFSFNWAD